VEISPALKALIGRQDGLVHRRQLQDHGVTDEAIRWALGRHWLMVLPDVVATTTGRLDARQRLVAGALYAGRDALLSGASAARWHGLTSPARTDHLRFLVPAHRSARRAGPVLVTRTSRPDEHAWHRPPLAVCAPARAVGDTARSTLSIDDATALVVEAVQRGVVRLDDLRHELEAGGRRHSRALRRALATAELGVWSLPESGLIEVLDRSSELPTMMANPVLVTADGTRLPTPDGWLDDVGLAIQVHSLRWHALGADWEGTVSGDTVYLEHGITVVAFTPSRIASDPAWVRQRVERIHATLQTGPRPTVTARPRISLVTAP